MTRLTERPIHHGDVARTSRGGAVRAALWFFASTFFGLTGTAQGQPANLTLSNISVSSGSSTYTATNSITAGPAFTVSGSGAVTFTAGSIITLLPGFQATAGSAPITFQASIGAVATAAVTIATNPAGQQATVDGASYTTPQTFNWVVGSQHTISAPATIAGTGMQGAFAGWSDGGAATHQIAVGSAGGTYTATYTTQYYLTTAVAGPGTVTPSSNWYAAGAQVAVTATPNAGSQFLGFSGTINSNGSPLTVTMNGPVAETAQFGTAPTVFTIAPTPAQNPYGSGWQIVQQGAPMVYTVLPPAGYPGWIQLSSVGVGCVINAPVFGVSGWGTGNADGSLTVTVTQDPVGFPASPCAQQSLQTYGNKIFLNLAIAVYGVNPPVNQQTFNMPLEVTTVPAISLAVSQLSQTGGMATYLATVSTTSYAGGVSLGLQTGSCAKLMGTPAVSLPAQPMAKIWVLTAGCAPGTNATLTFTAGNATVQADPQTVTLQTAPAAAVIRSPAPGSTIPGGLTTFNWSTVTGGTYCLYTGTVQQASCSGTAQPGVQVTLPPSGVVYATLGTQVNGGAWQYEQCVYTVNPNPSTAPLVVSGTTLVQVPNNGAKVRGTYYFSSGDPRTISSVSASVTGLTATVVGVTAYTATIEFQASSSVPAGSTASITAMDSNGRVLAIFEGEETVGGPAISVSPGQGVAGTPFGITETDGIAPAGPATPATLIISGDCPFVETDWQDNGFPGYTYYSQSAGNCTAQLFLSGDYAIALGLNETDWVWSDLMGFTVTPATPPPGATPTIGSISQPVVSGNTESVTITGSNFGAAGFVQACPQGSTGTDGCVQGTTTGPWNEIVLNVWWGIPSLTPGVPYCIQVESQFAGGWVPSVCVPVIFSSTPPAPTLQIQMSTRNSVGNTQTTANIVGSTQTLVIGQELVLTAQVSGGSAQNYTYQWSVPTANSTGSIWNDIGETSTMTPPAINPQQLASSSVDFMWTDCSGGIQARATLPSCVAGTVTLTATPVPGSGAPPLNSVSAQFNITVPQAVPKAEENGSISVPAPGSIALPSPSRQSWCPGWTAPALCLSADGNTLGMNFSVNGSVPPGRYEWVQVVNSAVIDHTSGSGNVCESNTAGHDYVSDYGSGYGGLAHSLGGKTAWDGPGVPLAAGDATVTVSESFTATLMFVPTTASGEPSGTTSNGASGNDLGTLVPLFTIGWTWAAEADLAISNPPPLASDWTSRWPDDGMGNPTDPVVASTSSYPQWSQVANPSAPCNPKPAIASVSPPSGPAGTAVTITGSNFGAAQGSSAVLFAGAAATVSNWSAGGNSITAAVPNLAAGPASIVVSVGGVASAPFSFTVTPAESGE
jgi:hypothetical protein